MRVLSMGAGVQTTACLLEYIDEYDAVLFADTGDEKPETYEYIEQYLKPFCSKYRTPFITLQSKYGTSLLQYCIDRKMMPTRMNRFCTREFKIVPIRRWLREHGATAKNPATVDLGISLDEVHRVNDSKYAVRYEKKNYPLIDDRRTRRDCHRIIIEAGWPSPVKSGCDYCPFMPKRNIRDLMGRDPARFDKVVEMETGAKNYPKHTLFDGLKLESLRQAGNLMNFIDDDRDLSCDSGHCFG